MSGAEAAGLVLGALPLVISAIENYKAGLGTVAAMVRWRGLLDTLLLRLRHQRTIFYLNIMILLRAAGVDNLSMRHESDCYAALLQDETDVRLKEYLDFAYDTFEDIIYRYHNCVRILVKKLTNIKRLSGAAKDDLKAIIDANSTNAKHVELFQRLDFTIERRALKDVVEELREDNLTLETVVRGIRTIRDYEQEKPSTDSTKLARTLQKVRLSSNKLFGVVKSAFEASCHDQHQVLLMLDARLDGPKPLLVGQNNSHKAEVSFEMAFALAEPSARQHHWCCAIIHAADEPDQHGSNPKTNRDITKAAGSAKRVAFAAPATASSRPHHSVADKITDLCSRIGTMSRQQQLLQFSLVPDALHHWSEKGPKVISTNQHATTKNFSQLVSFGEFLRHSRHDEQRHLGFQYRTALALTLASSIVQYKNTAWLTAAWDKDRILFPASTGHWHHISADRPVIAYTLDTHPQNALPSDFVDAKTAILELSILLLEIWHHRSLQDWCHAVGESFGTTSDSKRNVVIKWIEITSNKLTPNYLTAIEACLAICAGRLRSWDDEVFEHTLCEEILKPLMEDCKVWQQR